MANQKLSFKRNLSRRDTKTLNTHTHTVVTVLEWVLMAASAAFSYSFFEGLMGMIALPHYATVSIAALLTIVQSIAISRMYHSIVHDYLDSSMTAKTYMIALLTVGMIAFDLMANFAGIPMLASAVMKKADKFAVQRYEGEEVLADLTAKADAITARNTYKGRTWVVGHDREVLDKLNAAIAAHTAVKTDLLTAANAQHNAAIAEREKRLQLAIQFLGWFNVGAYIIMLLIVPVQHLTERENAPTSPSPTLPSGPGYRSFVDDKGKIISNEAPPANTPIGYKKADRPPSEPADTPPPPPVRTYELAPSTPVATPVATATTAQTPVVVAFPPMSESAIKAAISRLKSKIAAYNGRIEKSGEGEGNRSAKVQEWLDEIEALENMAPIAEKGGRNDQPP